jgi:hypothetical protein
MPGALTQTALSLERKGMLDFEKPVYLRAIGKQWHANTEVV